MPDEIAHRTKKYTRLFLIQMTVFGVAWIITAMAFSFAIRSPFAYILGDWIFRLFFLVTDVAFLSAFFKPNRRFPYLFKSRKSTSGDTSGGITGGSGNTGSEMVSVATTSSISDEVDLPKTDDE